MIKLGGESNKIVYVQAIRNLMLIGRMSMRLACRIMAIPTLVLLSCRVER